MQADYNTPYGIIYKATAPSGRAYIGQTTRTLTHRRGQHKTDNRCIALSNAIKKHGDKMRWEVIACAADRDGLDFAERALIIQHNTLKPHGYNLREGGASGKPTAETRAKISAANSGKKRTPEQCARISAMNLGRVLSPETCAKMSAAKTGRKLSPTHRAKISEGQRGKKMSQAAVEKSRLANIGRSRSASHRSNISEGMRRRWADPAFRRYMLLARGRPVV